MFSTNQIRRRKKMKSRVYGLIGISSVMANWNADFTGRPKSTSDGMVYGSDKALKYSMKKYLKDKGEKILYIKTYKVDEKAKGDQKLQPKELKERYNELFHPSQIEKNTPSKEVLKNLFSAVDVMNFGATFAVEDQNISITGAVQIGQGFNKYENSVTEVQDILSPFRNSKKEDADASSLGKKIISNEAHYIYPFSVNPKNYDEYIGIVEGFDGYSDEAYGAFKEAALVGATALNTNSKSGCENEFSLFIELKEGSELYLPNLDKYVDFEKGEDKNIFNLTRLKEILTDQVIKEFSKIEIYYNPYTVEIKANLIGAAYLNIFTKEEIRNS
jgi:CRISPR-associated protein Csh2